MGVAAEAAGEPDAGTLRRCEKRRARAEAETGDRDGSCEASRVVQRGDDGGDLMTVELERRERVELRHEDERAVAGVEAGEAGQVGPAPARAREALDDAGHGTPAALTVT